MPKGGKRKGAGRPEGTSMYKEKTESIRVPMTLVPHVKYLLENYIDNGLNVVVTEDVAPNRIITFVFY